MRAASLSVMCQWVVDAWAEIDKNIVIKSFLKCGISNALDGTGDDILWQGDIQEEGELVIDDEDNPYDDMLASNEWEELFGQSDDEEDNDSKDSKPV